jgi:hypothetical protein
MPNPVMGNSERAAVESKKREGSWKPKSELTPNRIFLILDARDVLGDPALSTPGVIADHGPACRIRKCSSRID